MAKLINTPVYEFSQNFFSLVNVLCIVILQSIENQSESLLISWMFLMLFVNILLLVELVIDFLVFGIVEAYKQHLRVSIETICQIINAFMMAEFFYSTVVNE